MAIGYLAVNSISRSSGRSATAAVAYRLGIEVADKRTGECHDYTRRKGVEWSGVVGWRGDAASLANAIEAAERRKDSKVARDIIIALPCEVKPTERRKLAEGYARWLYERHGTPCVVAIHAPGGQGDDRNWHAHILCATRRGVDGEALGEKARELDVKSTSASHIEAWRMEWGRLIDQDMRSHQRRGSLVEPEPKLPHAAQRAAYRAARTERISAMAQILSAEAQIRIFDAPSRQRRPDLRQQIEAAQQARERAQSARRSRPMTPTPPSPQDRADVTAQAARDALATIPAWWRWLPVSRLPPTVRDAMREAGKFAMRDSQPSPHYVAWAAAWTAEARVKALGAWESKCQTLEAAAAAAEAALRRARQAHSVATTARPGRPLETAHAATALRGPENRPQPSLGEHLPRAWGQLHEALQRVAEAAGARFDVLVWSGPDAPSADVDVFSSGFVYAWRDERGDRQAEGAVHLNYRIRDAATGHVIERPLALRYAAQIG